MALIDLLRRSAGQRTAERLYLAAVTQARRPGFYMRCAVPDTVDGRFDMIALHVYLVLRRLRAGGEAAAPVAQAVFDAMFADMDRSLREMGVGDLGVGRRVKAMAKAFYGRISAYDHGLDAGEEALAAALARNVFRAVPPPPAALAALAGYLRRETAALAVQPIDDLCAGNVAFGPAPESAAPAAAKEMPS